MILFVVGRVLNFFPAGFVEDVELASIGDAASFFMEDKVFGKGGTDEHTKYENFHFFMM